MRKQLEDAIIRKTECKKAMADAANTKQDDPTDLRARQAFAKVSKA